MNMDFDAVFEDNKPVVGTVHLLALPGTPKFKGSLDDIYVRALADAYALERAGVDAIIVENFGDQPYQASEPAPEQLALMAAVTREVKLHSNIPVGVDVHFNAWRASLAIAYACEAQFVRVDLFVDTVVAAQGLLTPVASEVMRYRHMLNAEDIQIWADIQPKSTRSLIPLSFLQSARDAEAAGADVVIITAHEGGKQLPLDEVAEAKQAVSIPVLVGSGITEENIYQVLEVTDGAIVGDVLKVDGDTRNAVSVDATAKFMKAARAPQEES